ncbi:HNH endonuclease, partial [Nocardioides agariphilus]
RLAYHWAILHPATTQTGTQGPDGAILTLLEKPASLGGDGTPAVAAFTHETLAAALDLTPAAGAGLIGDALDLHHRLPILLKRVEALQVPTWQARRVAVQTRHLPLDGARWVDTQLPTRTDGAIGPLITDRLVAHAAATFDPQTTQSEEEQAQASWGLEVSHPAPTDYTGTSHLTISGDTPTLNDFHTLVATLAHQLGQSGDTSPLGVRKITAIRIITHLAAGVLTGDRPLNQAGQAGLATMATVATLAGLHPEDLEKLSQAVTRHGSKIKLIAHVDNHDLEIATTPDGGTETALATGRIERLGATTIARLRAWVGHQAVQILPVLNMARRDAVDSHDPPTWMRELVILRDQTCISPRCSIDARTCDLDHPTPYKPLEEGGPPGQTHPENLAPLCRRHHRAKTAGTWRYHPMPEGYHWHGPHNTHYLRTPRGSQRI